MPSIGNALGQVVVARRAAQLGYLVVGLAEVTTALFENGAEVLLGFGMMNESGLELLQDLGVFLDRKMELRRLGVERRKGLLHELLRKSRKCERAFPRRKYDELSLVEALPPLLIRKRRIEINRSHVCAFSVAT
jgi:hypothetical protein